MNKQAKTVTVAVPVYNGEKYILESLQSIINQTVKVDKILISDNQSTDSTLNIIDKFIKAHPKRNIHLYQNSSNIGAIKNFNKCFELCDTDFLLILGTDDRLKKESVELHLKWFEQHPDLALVGGVFEMIDQYGNTIRNLKRGNSLIFRKGDILEFMKKTNFYMQHSTVMYNMKFTRQIGYFDTDFIAPDERLFVKHLISFPIGQIRERVAEVRLHSEQDTNDENRRFTDKIQHFKSNLKTVEFESSPERKKELEKLIKNWMVNQCIAIGKSIWQNDNMKYLATKYWLYGLKHNPSYFLLIYIRKGKHFAKRIFNIK